MQEVGMLYLGNQKVILAATCICRGAAAAVITPYSGFPIVLPGALNCG